MSSDQVRTVILEAVDCLRQRKCRPDRESIAVFVMRKLGSSMNEIFSEIENIVDLGELLKVEYKGSTSYRSPKNFDLKNSPLLTKHSKILNSSKTTRYVISGMNELLSTFPNYTQEGIPLEELKKKLSGFDEERFVEASVKVIFEREEAAGTIQVAQSTDDTLPYPVRVFPKDLQVPESMKLISFLEDPNPPPETKSRKRVKNPTEEGQGTKAKTPPHKNNVKTKKKPEVVYAVKSDPNKAAKINQEPSDGDADVKAKADQISSIGLKVLAGKTAKTPKQPKGKGNSKGGSGGANPKTDSTQMDEVLDRTPSLGLVKHETDSANSSEGTQQAPTHDAANGLTDGSSKSKPVPSKAVKRKSEVVNSPKGSRPTPTKAKKQKLNPTPVTRSENDTELKLSVSKEPPRYTYSAKRRVRYHSYDDDDNDNRLERSRSPPDEGNGGSPNGHAEICAACRKQENSAGQAEDFLSCGTCNAKIHPTCIDYSEDHAKRLRMNSKSNEPHLQWQCFSCKRCGVCQKALMSSKNNKINSEKRLTKKEQRYVLCDRCDRGYHASCINRTLPAPFNESSWYCSECEEASSNGSSAKGSVSPKKSNTGKQPAKKTVVKKKGRQQSRQSESGENMGNKNGIHSAKSSSAAESGNSTLEGDKEIPDISSWTPSQVQNYFTENGLREEASSLKEQEIDGMSLLLLRRADVIFGLNLRLGPALKIYRLVCQLQQHSSALKKKGSSSETATSAK